MIAGKVIALTAYKLMNDSAKVEEIKRQFETLKEKEGK
jgi:hypothetical protein